MKTTQKTSSLAALLSASILLAATPLAFAANNTWSGGGGNTTWSNNSNWSSNSSSSSDSAIIGSGGAAANLNGAQTVNDLTINRAAAFAISDSTNSSSGLTLTTGNLTFGGAGVFTYTISSNVTLGANGTWTGNSTNGVLAVSGSIKEANAGTKLTVVAGAGRVTLSGSNSFSGGLEVKGDAGAVWYQNTGAIGTGNLTISHSGSGLLQNVFGVDNGGTALAIYNNSVNLNNNTVGDVSLSANALNDRGYQINEITGTAGTSNIVIAARGKTVRIINGVSATGFNANGLQLYANNANPCTFEFGGSTAATFLNVGAAATGNQTANVLFTAAVNQNGTVGIGTALATGVNTFGITHVGGNSTFSGAFTIGNSVGAGAANLVAKDSGSRMIISGQVTDSTNTVALRINNSYTDNINGTNNPTGTVELSRAAGNTYDGTTTVYAGTLIVSNTSNSATGTGSVSVNAGARLGGNGIIAPTGSNGVTLNNTAILAPGDGTTGTLRLNSVSTTGSMLTMLSGAKFSMELGPSLASDKVNFWTYAGPTDFVRNSNVIDITFLAGSTTGNYTLFNFYSDAGTTLTASGISSGLSLNFTNGGNGTLDYSPTGQINLVVSAVPEPATWALLAVSLTTVMVLRRRRS